jgi:Protein of unknown function (DUF3303)
MKFVLAYTIRDGGSVTEREGAAKRALQLLGKFEPSVQISEWVNRVDGEGGFAIFESDDASAMAKDILIWGPLLKFELLPVVDVASGTAAQQEAIDFRDSIS